MADFMVNKLAWLFHLSQCEQESSKKGTSAIISSTRSSNAHEFTEALGVCSQLRYQQSLPFDHVTAPVVSHRRLARTSGDGHVYLDSRRTTVIA